MSSLSCVDGSRQTDSAGVTGLDVGEPAEEQLRLSAVGVAAGLAALRRPTNESGGRHWGASRCRDEGLKQLDCVWSGEIKSLPSVLNSLTINVSWAQIAVFHS